MRRNKIVTTTPSAWRGRENSKGQGTVPVADHAGPRCVISTSGRRGHSYRCAIPIPREESAPRCRALAVPGASRTGFQNRLSSLGCVPFWIPCVGAYREHARSGTRSPCTIDFIVNSWRSCDCIPHASLRSRRLAVANLRRCSTIRSGAGDRN